MSAEQLVAAARRAVEFAQAGGADQSEAFCQDERELEIRVYDRAVESLVEAGGSGVGIRVFEADGRSGYAFGTALDDASLKDLAERAVALARIADPDEHAGLPSACGSADTGPLVASDFDAARKLRSDFAARFRECCPDMKIVAKIEPHFPQSEC